MLTVVIPAYNEEKTISSCLQSLVNQDIKQNFEVIVVNNNSTDSTVKVASKFKDVLSLQIISEKRKGRGIARKRGFDTARGEIIFSTDADTILPKNWLSTLTYELENQECVAVTGSCVITDCSTVKNTIFNISQPLTMHLYRLLFGHYWLSGFNFAIYKDTYNQTSGFDVTLNAQEDIDLSFKVSRIGKIKFCNNMPIIFSGRRFKKGLLQGSLQYLKSFIDWYVFKKKTATLSDVR